jgi:hypothetical protein
MATKTQPAPTQAPATNGTAPRPAAETPLLDAALVATAERLDLISRAYRREVEDENVGRIRKALATSNTIAAMEAALDDRTMQQFMRLMNTELGFKTDRPNKACEKPYGIAVVRRVLIAGFLKGAYPVGNELNIISGNLMLVKNFYVRKIAELDGVAGEPVYGASLVRKNGPTWKVRGFAFAVRHGQRIEIRDDKRQLGIEYDVSAYGDAPDNMIGKAERRALRDLYRLLSGNTSEDDEPAETAAPAKQEQPAPQQQAAKPADPLKEGRAALSRCINAARDAGVFDNDKYRGFLTELKVTNTNELSVDGLAKLCDKVAGLVAAKHNAEPATPPDHAPAEYQGDPDPTQDAEHGDAYLPDALPGMADAAPGQYERR